MLYRTDRLLVRHLVEADVEAMVSVYGDAEAMRWVSDGSTLDRAECLGWVEVTLRNYAKRGYGMSALTLADTGEVVGFCGVVHPKDQPEPEIKYALARAHWGGGLATEAVGGMLAYAAEQHGLSRIIATVDPANAASQRVLAKVGMLPAASEPSDEDTLTLVWVA